MIAHHEALTSTGALGFVILAAILLVSVAVARRVT